MIKTILVDDEPRGLNTLKKLLQEYCPDLKIIAECEDADSAKQKVQTLSPQLVFLDISLPGKTSFDLLTELGQINFEIIFVTAHHQYTLQAFRYSAVDYLVKPIDEDLLADAVKRAIKKINATETNKNINTLLHNIQQTNQSSQEMKICIPSLKGFQVLNLNEIIFCEGSGSYTNIIVKDKPVICSAKPVYEYEDLLSDAGFVRIHKSYLVNLTHVESYIRGEGGSVMLSNGKELEVSRRKKDNFLTQMKSKYKY